MCKDIKWLFLVLLLASLSVLGSAEDSPTADIPLTLNKSANSLMNIDQSLMRTENLLTRTQDELKTSNLKLLDSDKQLEDSEKRSQGLVQVSADLQAALELQSRTSEARDKKFGELQVYSDRLLMKYKISLSVSVLILVAGTTAYLLK